MTKGNLYKKYETNIFRKSASDRDYARENGSCEKRSVEGVRIWSANGRLNVGNGKKLHVWRESVKN